MSKQSDTSKLIHHLRIRLGAAIAARLGNAQPIDGRQRSAAPYRRRMLEIAEDEPFVLDDGDLSDLMLDPLTNLYLRANQVDFLNELMSVAPKQDEAAAPA